MKKLPTRLRIFYAIVGVCLLVYGLRTLLARKISAESARGAGWLFQDQPAVLIGFLLGVAGAYIIYLAFNQDE